MLAVQLQDNLQPHWLPSADDCVLNWLYKKRQ